MEIKNIIFDLGGVLLNIDYKASIKAFKELGVINFDEFFTQSTQVHLFDRLDTGEVTPEGFRNEIRQISSVEMTDDAIDKAWNAMLLDFPSNKIPMLEQVGTHYRTFLLSNTNAIHYPAYSQSLKDAHGYESLARLFEQQYLSHEIGLRKPNAEAFHFVVEKNNLDPEKTLFFDDTMMHVQGARRAGIHAYWLDIIREDVVSFFENGKLTYDFFRKLQNQYELSDQ
jgi:glucose-1-phosphatase